MRPSDIAAPARAPPEWYQSQIILIIWKGRARRIRNSVAYLRNLEGVRMLLVIMAEAMLKHIQCQATKAGLL